MELIEEKIKMKPKATGIKIEASPKAKLTYKT